MSGHTPAVMTTLKSSESVFVQNTSESAVLQRTTATADQTILKCFSMNKYGNPVMELCSFLWRLNHMKPVCNFFLMKKITLR